MNRIYYRWSDRDHRWGPFIYARDSAYHRPFAIEIQSSGDEDDRPFSTLRLRGFGHTLIVILPPIVKPARTLIILGEQGKADTGISSYERISPREYGISLFEGHLSVSFGRVTHDSSTEQRWGMFLPWTQWRHVRHSYYDLTGAHVADVPQWGGRPALVDWQVRHAEEERIKALVPTAQFAFKDYDGEQLTATTKIDEREWRRGTGWCRWMSLVWPKKVRRSLDIWFSGETGKRKGSWKGGTLGTGIDMLPGELHEDAFNRYCQQNGMTFIAALN